MSFAKVTDNNINKIVTRLPETAQRLDNGAWVMALRRADTATQEACGWYKVVDEPRPTTDTGVPAVDADPDADPPVDAVEGVPGDPTIVVQRRSVMVDGVPTRRWFERPKTDAELAKDAVKDADAAERKQLRTVIAALSDIADGTSADKPAVQLKKLARVVRRLAIDAALD